MKKILALCVLALVGLSLYTYKISCELRATKEVKVTEIVGLMERIMNENRPAETYVGLETSTLPEPGDMKGADVLERLKMLKEHISFGPSPEWIREVLAESEMEIERLRTR